MAKDQAKPETTPKSTFDESRRIFTSLGFLPEPGAYALAKFSRSTKPYEDWIVELTSEGAEKFFNTYYFQYGHASIADLGHVCLVAENISMLAAVELFNLRLQDGQESSTRYQDWTKRGILVPPEIKGKEQEISYVATYRYLIEIYKYIHEKITEVFKEKYTKEKLKNMDQAAYERTVAARAFDVARYLLPVGCLTGMGNLTPARNLEKLISQLLSHPLKEIQDIGQEVKAACKEKPAFNTQKIRVEKLLKDGSLPNFAGKEKFLNSLKEIIYADAKSLPTLVKYADRNEYLVKTYQELKKYADRALKKLGSPKVERRIQLIPPHDQDLEVAATLLYRVSPFPYIDLLNFVRKLSKKDLSALIDLAYKFRGAHDEPILETRAGYELIFDVWIDCGAFRDLHRHRNCVQIIKDFEPSYGFDVPKDIVESKLDGVYESTMNFAASQARELDEKFPLVGGYILPLGFRRPFLFKIDSWELGYIVENRTSFEGHFSYREAAWEMLKEFEKKYPGRAKHIRAVNPNELSFFKR
ncbi:MAG: hypothetical protein A2Y57_03845 [Candidatus Woykebacteria bacterium RBG_13_40_7b]|uniref:Alternative thymidylate synthase n=1 Tax=Candidatus Woykebacteria bacterium RBG_13_40_7b TaxID=1802594 RepID=A0A1G1WC02_9BACT|nr:MAG: hypothetical protein A2Y57_03845 [Candidatus Woykebacteria bacterium RBG_13_40_7b]